MSLFVEVNDTLKGCPVIINLDHVVEITPLRSGGCEVCFNDSAAVAGKRVVNVKEEYSMFQQLVMHMVTPESMQKRIAQIKQDAEVLNVPSAGSEQPRGRGRPPKSTIADTDIPKL